MASACSTSAVYLIPKFTSFHYADKFSNQQQIFGLIKGEETKENGGSISWFGPVAPDFECGKADLNEVQLFSWNEKAPEDVCTEAESELCFCIARGRLGKLKTHKLICAPCKLEWNYEQFIDEDENPKNVKGGNRKSLRKERKRQMALARKTAMMELLKDIKTVHKHLNKMNND